MPSLLLDGRYAGQYCEPLALETVFGWILMGPVSIRGQPAITSLCFICFRTVRLYIETVLGARGTSVDSPSESR